MKKITITFFLTLLFCSIVLSQKTQEKDIVAINETIIEKFIVGIENRTLNILEIPKPKYPILENGTICATGVVRVRVEFLSSGKIGKVYPVSDLGYDLTKSAVEAAKKIKFEPAIKDGKIISIFKVIPFNFSIY